MQDICDWVMTITMNCVITSRGVLKEEDTIQKLVFYLYTVLLLLYSIIS